ncbi:MAG: ABC transporter permease subunit [Usitatibacteraceae bacterium]
MMWSTILTVCRKELVDHLRDRRTAAMIFFLSIAMGPLLLIGLTQFIASVEKKAEAREVFVQGKENSPEIANFFARQDVTIKEPKPEFRAMIKDGKHDPVLVIPKDFTEKFQTGTAEVDLVFDDTRQDSGNASIGVLRRLVRGFNAEVSNQRLIARGVSPQLVRAVDVQDINLGTAAQRAAGLLFIIPWITLLGCVSGVTAIAIDVTAGERERGSLEPLLMNPVTRAGIVTGKWLAVAMYGLTVATLTMCGFALTLKLAPLPNLASVLSISPAQYLGFGITMFSFAPAMGALQMLIATYGRTYKEAQTYVSYLIMAVSMVPAIGMLAQFKDATWQLFVPMLGQLMVITRILRGETVTALHYLLPFALNATISLVAVLVISKLLTKEKIIFGRA